MRDIFVARQPIFDRTQHVQAYELLFRSGLKDRSAEVEDGNEATARVLVESFLTIGLSRLTGGKRAFINFTRESLLSEAPLLFPKEEVVVEVLEDVNPDRDLVEACRELKTQGYTLALDDFVFDESYWDLIQLADIIKVDFLATDQEKRRELKSQVGNGINWLAEKVETQEEFKEAVDQGYSYFQGYFFSRPQVMAGKRVAAFKVTYLKALQAVRRSQMDFQEVEQIIRTDLSLSYKLLRYINTAAFALVKPIESIGHAISLLGQQRLKKLISLIVMSGLAEDRPEELLIQSLVRASVFETLAPQVQMKDRGFDLFLMGMFSMIDAALGVPLEDALTQLPLPEDVKAALLGEPNRFRDLLEIVGAYEKGDWESFANHSARVQINASEFPGLYVAALEEAHNTLQF